MLVYDLTPSSTLGPGLFLCKIWDDTKTPPQYFHGWFMFMDFTGFCRAVRTRRDRDATAELQEQRTLPFFPLDDVETAEWAANRWESKRLIVAGKG